MRSDQTTGGSRTAHDGRGEGALGESDSAGGRAPRKAGGGTLEEHCPKRTGGMREGGVWGWREFGGLRLGEFEVRFGPWALIGLFCSQSGPGILDQSAQLIGCDYGGRHELNVQVPHWEGRA